MKIIKKYYLMIPAFIMIFAFTSPIAIYAQDDQVPVTDESTDQIEEPSVEESQPDTESDPSQQAEPEQTEEQSEETETESTETTQEEANIITTPEQENIETAQTEPIQALVLTPKMSRATEEQILRYIKPNFNDQNAYGYLNPYTAAWMGQCTWFTWGRFYEIYGYSPGFTGNGCDCVLQLITAHPDLWYLSDTPVIGSIFSADAAHNHVGMIVGKEGDLYIIQEGNLNGRNDSWDEVETDCWTQTYTLEELRACYGNVTFANPITPPDEAKLRTDYVEPAQQIQLDTSNVTEELITSNKRKYI